MNRRTRTPEAEPRQGELVILSEWKRAHKIESLPAPHFETRSVTQIAEWAELRDHWPAFLCEIEAKPLAHAGAFNLDQNGVITRYGAAEGEPEARLVGKNFFTEIVPQLEEFLDIYEAFLQSGFQKIFRLPEATVSILRITEIEALVICKREGLSHAAK
jgi:hypothetical protein